MFKIREFARLSQVSVRALRYYDAIGFSGPSASIRSPATASTPQRNWCVWRASWC